MSVLKTKVDELERVVEAATTACNLHTDALLRLQTVLPFLGEARKLAAELRFIAVSVDSDKLKKRKIIGQLNAKIKVIICVALHVVVFTLSNSLNEMYTFVTHSGKGASGS